MKQTYRCDHTSDSDWLFDCEVSFAWDRRGDSFTPGSPRLSSEPLDKARSVHDLSRRLRQRLPLKHEFKPKWNSTPVKNVQK